MNRLENNLASSDEFDRLVGGFFQAEMPHPWPAAPRRPKTMLPREERSWLGSWISSGRFALALSVALLLVAAWILSGVGLPTSSTAGPNAGPPTAGKGKTALPEKLKQPEDLEIPGMK